MVLNFARTKPATMIYKLIAVLLFSITAVHSQEIINDRLFTGKVDSLHSFILNEKEKCWISLPTNFNNPRFSKMRYPVIYVLDGDANFYTVSAMARQLSVRNGNSVLPEVIVVGVLNNDRTRDFTPYPSSFWVYNTPSPLENTGGGEKFASYLHEELFRYIDSVYPTAPYRVLIGHSLGGLAATNIFINHRNFFNGYLVIDPSMWYDNQGVLKQVDAALQHQRFDGTGLYLAMANTLVQGIDTSRLKTDTSAGTLHPRSIFRFKELLQRYPDNGLHAGFRYYENDSHMSLPLIAEYDGLRFLFDFYHLPANLDARFLEPDDHIDPAEIMTAHFAAVSQKMGYTVLPPQSLVNIYANTLLNNYMVDKARLLYSLNTTNYPESYGAWESLGDFYVHEKDKQMAVQCYQKALKLNNSEAIREKLNSSLKQ